MGRMIEVRAHPRARTEKVERTADNAYEVWTNAPPDKGAANDSIARLLARELRVAPSTVVLRRGPTSRNKLFEVTAPPDDNKPAGRTGKR
jgi:uncharacterized protein